MSLSFSSSTPVITLIGHEIIDVGVLANGRPDPGETVDLLATVRNLGTAATGVQLALESTDPFLAITDASSTLGDIPAGGIVDTSADPISFQVSPDAPTGHIARLTVRATFTGGETPSDLGICIGRFDYLVWDPTSDRTSGPAIASELAAWQYSGSFRGTLPMGRLDDYATLWVSCGIYPENVVIDDTGPEGPAIAAYLANGGNVYLEGGDIWAFDPQYGGYDFGPLFGIIGSQDGGADLSIVHGVPGSFTDGMDLIYIGENSYIDHVDPTAHGVAVLHNSSPSYTCGVAGDAGTYRTVGTSFELGGLKDGVWPSTKAELVREIMGFFGVAEKALFADGFESGTCDSWSAVVQ